MQFLGSQLLLLSLLYAGKLVISAFFIYSLRGLLNVTYLVIRIEPLELFDEFEEWHMLPVTKSFPETESSHPRRNGKIR